MRILVLFDLPSVTTNEKREYHKFRKFLLKTGFVMMQESVYCKLMLNATVTEGMMAMIKRNKPPAGIVQVLTITEKQFAKMQMIVGEKSIEYLDTDERLVIL